MKTCSYDCVYCQLGRTTCKTSQRRDWVPIDEVLAQLDERLADQPDYITLGGCGEPTLCRDLGRLIEEIHKRTNVPVAVLTNGSLLWRKEVRDELAGADLVIPSLDAGDEATFQRVNCPCPTISFEAMLQGLVSFRQEFSGDYWLEVFVLPPEIQDEATWPKIVRHVARIQPDRVQLNTATRPPRETFAKSVPGKRLAMLATHFTPHAEVIADVHGVHDLPEFHASQVEILALLRRRPCSLDDIAAGLGTHRNEIVKHIESLQAQAILRQSVVDGRCFYSVAERCESGRGP